MPTRVAIHLPELGSDPILLSAWFAEVGDPVFVGDRLVEVLVQGATFDVSAPATGRLLEKQAHRTDRLAAGQILGLLEIEEGSDPDRISR